MVSYVNSVCVCQWITNIPFLILNFDPTLMSYFNEKWERVGTKLRPGIYVEYAHNTFSAVT